jgi:hypothetical protein
LNIRDLIKLRFFNKKNQRFSSFFFVILINRNIFCVQQFAQTPFPGPFRSCFLLFGLKSRSASANDHHIGNVFEVLLGVEDFRWYGAFVRYFLNIRGLFVREFGDFSGGCVLVFNVKIDF